MDKKPVAPKKPRVTVTKGIRLTPDELGYVGKLLGQYPECASEAELLRQATLIGLYVLAAQATVLPAIDFLFAHDAYPALYRLHAAGSVIEELPGSTVEGATSTPIAAEAAEE